MEKLFYNANGGFVSVLLTHLFVFVLFAVIHITQRLKYYLITTPVSANNVHCFFLGRYPIVPIHRHQRVPTSTHSFVRSLATFYASALRPENRSIFLLNGYRCALKPLSAHTTNSQRNQILIDNSKNTLMPIQLKVHTDNAQVNQLCDVVY